jgi:hypothetical protein
MWGRSSSRLRVFLAGALSGAALTIAVGAVWLWREPYSLSRDDASTPAVSEDKFWRAEAAKMEEDQRTYDACLVEGPGADACGAEMPIRARERADDEAEKAAGGHPPPRLAPNEIREVDAILESLRNRDARDRREKR